MLVRGNHDKKHTLELPWAEMYEEGQRTIRLNKRSITLNHYSMQVWPASHKGTWHLFGHSHGTCTPIGRSMDIGVDAVAMRRARDREKLKFARYENLFPHLRREDYVPLSFDEVGKILDSIP